MFTQEGDVVFVTSSLASALKLSRYGKHLDVNTAPDGSDITKVNVLHCAHLDFLNCCTHLIYCVEFCRSCVTATLTSEYNQHAVAETM